MSGEHPHPEYALADPTAAALAALQTRVEQVAGELTQANARMSRLTAQVVALEAQAAKPQDVYDYVYLGKPTGSQTIGRTWTRVDLTAHTGDVAGLEVSLQYLNIGPVFAAGRTTGVLRVRIMRGDGDATGYQDLPVDAYGLDGDGRTTRTLTYFEATDGTATWVEARCIGGLRSAELGTRYRKVALIKDRG